MIFVFLLGLYAFLAGMGYWGKLLAEKRQFRVCDILVIVLCCGMGLPLMIYAVPKL